MNVLDNGEDVDDVLLIEGLACLAVECVFPQLDLDPNHLTEPSQQRHFLDAVHLKHGVNRLPGGERCQLTRESSKRERSV